MVVSSNIKNTAFLVSQHTVTYHHLDPKILLCTHKINHVLSLVQKNWRLTVGYDFTL